jgi:hypothetical protein
MLPVANLFVAAPYPSATGYPFMASAQAPTPTPALASAAGALSTARRDVLRCCYFCGGTGMLHCSGPAMALAPPPSLQAARADRFPPCALCTCAYACSCPSYSSDTIRPNVYCSTNICAGCCEGRDCCCSAKHCDCDAECDCCYDVDCFCGASCRLCAQNGESPGANVIHVVHHHTIHGAAVPMAHEFCV